MKATKTLFLTTLATLALSAQAAEPATLKLTQTIPLPGVKGRFDHFAIDTSGKRLFVAALGNNTLEVVDLAAGKRIRSLAGMSKPTGVLFLSRANQLIVANGDDGTLKILSGDEFKVLQNLTALADADNLRYDPQTKFAWLGYGEGALAIIDMSAAKLLASVKLPAHPESFQLEPDGRRIFVNVPDAKQVAVIDRVKRTVTATWPMETFQANFPLALDETNHRLFVGCRKPARLVVLDTATGQPVTNLAISGDIDDLFYDAPRKRLYLSCGEGFLDTVEQTTADTYRRVSQLPTAPGARTCYFSPGPDRLYLAVPDRGPQKAEIRIYQPQ
jgi:DNA-binding beta-propeller fold protein YncE